MATPPEMKAWTYTTTGYPTALTLSTVPSPPSPAGKPTDTLLIRTKAAAINPVDIQLMNVPLWSLLPSSPALGVLNRPKILAQDFSGVVLARGTGAKAARFNALDEVFGISFILGHGTLAEACPVDMGDKASSVVVKKPEEWSWAQAASLPLVWLTARTALEHVTPAVEAGRKKLVVLGGSSATGMYAVWMAQQRGWDVLSTCSGRNVEFVRSMGAGTVVDYTAQSVPEEVARFAPDAILDCVGGTECVNLAGRYVTIVGDKTARTSVGGALLYYTHPAMLIRWALGRLGLGVHYDCVNIQYRKDWLEEALELPPEKIAIDGEYGFERVKEAFERLNTGRARGKVVVTVGEE